MLNWLSQIRGAPHRILKDDGLLVFTFHHSKTWAWEGIAQLLLDAGSYVSASPIVRFEGKSGFHSSEGNIRYDAVLVCRKLPSPHKSESWTSLKRWILLDSVEWIRRTLDSGMAINPVDIFAIVMSKTLEYFTKAKPPSANGDEPITIADAIREMNELVDVLARTSEDEAPQANRRHDESCQQLVLALAESRRRFNGKRSPSEHAALNTAEGEKF